MNEIFYRQPLPKNIPGASSVSQKAENSLEKTNSISMCILANLMEKKLMILHFV